MKFKTLLFFVVAGVAVCNAQVNLDINDCPSPGLELNVTEYYSGALDLNDSVDIGMAGSNGTYDISSITNFVGESTVVNYISPSETDWSAQHPSANVSAMIDIETDSATGDTFVIQYNYYLVNDDGCTEAGISFLLDTGYVLSQVPSGNLIETHASYNPGGNQLNTSYQMGYNAMDTSYWEANIGDIYHSETVIREVYVDGYGQLITPDGIVDVLRVQITSFDINYTEVNGNAVENDSDTSHYYEFWASDVGEAVAKVYVNDAWNYVYEVEYSTVTKAGSGYQTSVNEAAMLNYSIYPNPVDDQLNIDIEPNNNMVIDIYNILGDRVIRLNAVNSHHAIDVSTFKNGVYFLNISNSGEVLRTEKIIVNR